MRISDWSSDVCSSDLQAVGDRVQVDLGLAAAGDAVEQQRGEAVDVAQRRDRGGLLGVGFRARLRRWCELRCGDRDAFDQFAPGQRTRRAAPVVHQPGERVFVARGLRSEEHTSELQSLMRISYAVFCLKKKKTKPHPIR